MEDLAMTGMAAPEEPMAPEAAPEEEAMPMEAEQSKFDMETLMGNFLDMEEERRKIATRLLASPAAEVLDEILGEPVLARLTEQLGTPVEGGEATAEEEPAGMMAPTEEPMAEAPEAMPMEDEEATPPV